MSFGRTAAPGRAALRRALRLIVITDRRLAAPRSPVEVVRAAVAAGARAIQLRDKDASAADLLAQARELLSITRPAGALLFVNDRWDVALSAGADGAHLGPDDVPLEAVRAVVPPGFLLGYSTDDPERARDAERMGADYIGCGAVFATSTKDVGSEAIGADRLDQVARSVAVPVVGIGGITTTRARELASTAAAGIAVVGAVMTAPDPKEAVAELLAAFE